MKIRKNHARKRYRYNVNRKTLRKTRTSTGKIKDPLMKNFYEYGKRPGKNFYEMGLSSDPNKAVAIPNFKQERLNICKIVNGFVEEEIDEVKKPAPPRQHVAKKLEEISKQRADPEFRLPKGVVKELTYFLDKYKLNYKAMVTDQRNHNQLTWRQFRMKIRRFMGIPEQFNPYLEKKHLQPGAQLSWDEYESDSEWK